MNLNIIIAFFVLIAIIQIIAFRSAYKIPNLSNALVVYGKLDPKDSVPFKIYISKSVFVWPIIQKSYFLDLDSYIIEKDINATFIDGEKSTIKIKCQLIPDKSNLKTLVERYFKKTKLEIENDIKYSIELLVQNITNSTTYENKPKELLKIISNKTNNLIQKSGFEHAKFINVFIESN